MRAGETEWAHALAGGLSVWGAEGSFKLCFSSFAPRQIEQARLHSVWRRLSGLTANVPEAGKR